jgi:hypothetical protein
VTLSATPATGFSFSGWGSDCSGPGGCTVTLSKEATVFANFVTQTPPPPAQVHLRVSASGRGTVTGAGLSCGEGASTCDALVTSGSAVTLTATGGTGARFMGWGGPCSGTASTCGFTVQSDTDVTAEFQSEVVALAPNDGTNGMVIALNSTHVFWPRFGSAGNGIWAVPKNGGAAVKVAGGFANAIVADDAFLYWTDGSNVYSTPVGGGEVALLASAGRVGKLALDEVGALYWVVTASGDLTGSVHRMQDRFDSVLARGENPNGPIAVDATHVYFTGNRAGGFIRRVPRKGGEVETVLDCGSRCFPRALRVDSRFIYFRVFTAAPSGQVEAFNKADGSLRVISGGNDPGGLGDVNQSGADVDVNDFVVYWNWSGGKSPYGIFRANADGTGFAAVDSSEDIGWLALRVDDRAVYYLHSGAIIRRLK